ncbi:HNH endonuclease signature motif containing protein [Bradyrhizobium sp. Ash2021]|uniref:HNH endonuclease n=1 Tax=Bradyrhizobium sp. Ash2021 TaxID=2954771 RepID=UPI002815C173|nr:HNH endonuclease signature motif containing protein [Bradyrhizobium sp. Ash2021]WMT76475.1 HNH endonuclease [Bradyrhizobium sp. Ash2021]
MTCLPNFSPSPTTGPADQSVRDRIVGAAASVPPTAERPATMASPLSSANVAIVMSVLIGMGVLFTSTLPGETDESPRAGDDPANPRGAQVARRPDYAAHINSDAWKSGAARLTELAASGFRCRICNQGADEARLEVHHRTYENFGHELAADLTTLCSDCHLVNTDALRRRGYTDFVPVLADVAFVERAPLFDPMRKGDAS